MLYPFPEEEIRRVLAGYPHIQEVVWVQEEPRNMGAWSYMYPRLVKLLGRDMKLNIISRPDRSSPASGFWDVYMVEQEQIIAQASGLPLKETGGKHVR
jgi:2-oxoglutarate dehydrogenase E1 component